MTTDRLTEEFAGQRVLITGAAGFIGRRLVEACRARGAEVFGVTRSATSGNPAVQWRSTDLANAEAVRALVDEVRPACVFHLAGFPHATRALTAVLPSMRDNLIASVNLFAALVEAAEQGHAARRVVVAGSFEAGEAVIEGNMRVTRHVGAAPSSPYAASKLAASRYAEMFHDLYALPVATARIFMTYGPGQHLEKFVSYVARSLLRGEPPRLTAGFRCVDWIFVDDVVDGLMAMGAAGPHVNGQTIDLGSGEATSLRHVAELIAAAIGTEIRPDYGSVAERPAEQERIADVADTLARIGWRPRISLGEGLRRTVEWCRGLVQDQRPDASVQAVQEGEFSPLAHVGCSA